MGNLDTITNVVCQGMNGSDWLEVDCEGLAAANDHLGK